MEFTIEQKTFLIESYFRNGHRVNGEWVYSVELCLEEFRVQFPNAAVEYHIFKSCLTRCVQKFRETGSVLRKTGSGPPKKRTAEVIAQARDIMENEPGTSIRHLRQQLDTPLSLGSTHVLLHKDLNLYPYRVTMAHELLPIDYPKRLEFCNWILNKLVNNENFCDKIIFTDEAWFHLSGFINSQNMRIWGTEKPQNLFERPLHPLKIGVWAAVTRNRIIGPIFFQGNKKHTFIFN